MNGNLPRETGAIRCSGFEIQETSNLELRTVVRPASLARLALHASRSWMRAVKTNLATTLSLFAHASHSLREHQQPLIPPPGAATASHPIQRERLVSCL